MYGRTYVRTKMEKPPVALPLLGRAATQLTPLKKIYLLFKIQHYLVAGAQILVWHRDNRTLIFKEFQLIDNYMA